MATSSRKTTDLERLTQPGGKVMPDDATIPILTERLTLPSLDLDISLPRPPPPVVAPVTPPPPPPAAAEPAPPPAARPAPPPSTLFASVASVAPVFSQPSYPPAPAPAIEAAKPVIDWQKIEAQLRDGLLRELQPQLSAELERQVRERLQPTLVRALTALISDLRPALDTTVRETISRAISAELERQRSALK